VLTGQCCGPGPARVRPGRGQARSADYGGGPRYQCVGKPRPPLAVDTYCNVDTGGVATLRDAWSADLPLILMSPAWGAAVRKVR
jgi:hypothetical protein